MSCFWPLLHSAVQSSAISTSDHSNGHCIFLLRYLQLDLILIDPEHLFDGWLYCLMGRRVVIGNSPFANQIQRLNEMYLELSSSAILSHLGRDTLADPFFHNLNIFFKYYLLLSYTLMNRFCIHYNTGQEKKEIQASARSPTWRLFVKTRDAAPIVPASFPKVAEPITLIHALVEWVFFKDCLLPKKEFTCSRAPPITILDGFKVNVGGSKPR